MGQFFNNQDDACVWLYVNGWRQNGSGNWLKAGKRADIRKSPANDGVVCVVISKT
jgi:hypothetical protein